jgi:glycosyltransferase involved in cell wall biosynthesis
MVFQGGINPVRNVDELILALTMLSEDIHIGFITYAKDIPYYEEMTQRLGVFHRVHYVIEIPWDEVISWLASSDVGIMPYQVTNFNAKISSPNKLYEFVVAGLPIIASSDLVNVQRAVDEDSLGLTTVLREPDSYVEVIRAMFEHPNGPERFRKNVLKARSKYTWSNEEPKLLKLYKKICSPNYQVKSKQSRIGEE